MPTLTIKDGKRILSLSKPEIKRLSSACDVLEALDLIGVDDAGTVLAGILGIIKTTEATDGEPT